MSTSLRLALTYAFCIGNGNVNATPIENDDDCHRPRLPTDHLPSLPRNLSGSSQSTYITALIRISIPRHEASRGVSISTVEHGIRSEIIYAEIITTITTNEHIHITQTSPISHRLTSISCDDRQHHKIVLIGRFERSPRSLCTGQRIRSGYLPFTPTHILSLSHRQHHTTSNS